MLRIVKSGLSSGARESFFEKIKKLCEEEKKSYLIVPEQQTVMAEGVMSKILPPSSALVFEVTNFTRLANSTFRTLGGLAAEYCDSAKKSLLMWRTLTELSPTLSMTSGRGDINSGLVESALGAVKEMQSKGITPGDLFSASENSDISSDGRLFSRVCDLAGIYALYKKLLNEKYADTGDDADAMIQKLRENPAFLSDSTIFIEGFTSFTEPQYRLIALLAGRCDVYVALTLPKGNQSSFEYTEIRDTETTLVRYAAKAAADVKLSYEAGWQKGKESLCEICDLLWMTYTPNEKISLQNVEDLRIFEAETPYEECAFICEDIKRRVMLGAKYSDFAIVSRSAEKYDGILDRALFSAKIPAFTSYRRELSEYEAIKLIYTAYSVCRGFRREDVISYAKCALSGVSREECDEFEMYVNKWQINGRRFTDGLDWNMNPDGYSSHRADNIGEKLARINDVKDRIITPLGELSLDISSAKSVREHAERLVNFLLKIDLESALSDRADALEAMGEEELAEENRVLWKLICSSLDTLVSVLGDCPADAESFLSQLKVVFSASDIGRIPAFTDQVTVGSADMLRLYEKPHIYLIGVNSGAFPETVSDRSYFSDRDKLRLADAGLLLAPELEIKGARELYFFSRAFSYATDSVTISYSSADTRFKAIEPADVIKRISHLTGGDVKPVKISQIDIKNRLFSPETALDRMGEFDENYSTVKDALIRSGYEGKVRICEGDISNTNVKLGKDILRESEGRRLSLTQTRIDSYVSCPFGYFCRYSIGLTADERAEFDARSIGSFIHGILENFFVALSKDGRRSGDLTADERKDLTRAAAEKYIAQLGEDVIGASVRTRIKIERLCRAAGPVVDGLCEEFAHSAFEPRFFELSLGRDENSPDAVKINTDRGAVNIYGIIDRVDAYKKGEDVYLRVVDYKTGQKAFSPDDLAEGTNLQMFLYLKSLVESDKKKYRESIGVGDEGKILPAGVIYVKTAVSDIRVDTPDDHIAEVSVKNAQEREGMMLDDPDVIEAMTLRYSPVYSPSYPNEIRPNKKHLLFTEESWGDIMQTVEGSVIKVADGIRDGEMPACPKDKKGASPCEYCDFKPICRR